MKIEIIHQYALHGMMCCHICGIVDLTVSTSYALKYSTNKTCFTLTSFGHFLFFFSEETHKTVFSIVYKLCIENGMCFKSKLTFSCSLLSPDQHHRGIKQAHMYVQM